MCHPKGRDDPLTIYFAATVRLSRSWEDLYRHRPLFTLLYRHHPQKKMQAALTWGCTAVVGDFPCLARSPSLCSLTLAVSRRAMGDIRSHKAAIGAVGSTALFGGSRAGDDRLPCPHCQPPLPAPTRGAPTTPSRPEHGHTALHALWASGTRHVHARGRRRPLALAGRRAPLGTAWTATPCRGLGAPPAHAPRTPRPLSLARPARAPRRGAIARCLRDHAPPPCRPRGGAPSLRRTPGGPGHRSLGVAPGGATCTTTAAGNTRRCAPLVWASTRLAGAPPSRARSRPLGRTRPATLSAQA